MNEGVTRVVAVLVTYRPDLRALENGLMALAPQVNGIVLVDNGSGADVQGRIERCLAQAEIPYQALFQTGNKGLAQAQNAGIAIAREMGADAILLMDQDSQPAPDMVAALQAAFVQRQADNPAVIGPGYEEPHRGTDAALPVGEDVPEMPALISSGSLIPLAVFDRVGGLDEGLFIDFVDTDWCFRARAKGYRCFAARAARMTHRIGDSNLRVAGRHRSVHGAGRMYYQIRNLLLLVRRPATPWGWFWRMLPRYLGRSLILALAVPPRGQRARAVAHGLWHGIIGRSGPYHKT